ncbi:unnamed protein product [Symbiodinium microadriaticum]|nr:unnamed protein product [Symbiodinium microadriaticum]
MEIHVQIPEGAKPGSTFQAQANGQVFTVLVPDGTKPGQTIRVPMQAVPAPAVPVWQPPLTEPTPYLQFVWVVGGALTAGVLSWVGVCANNVSPPQTAREINASKYVYTATDQRHDIQGLGVEQSPTYYCYAPLCPNAVVENLKVSRGTGRQLGGHFNSFAQLHRGAAKKEAQTYSTGRNQTRILMLGRGTARQLDDVKCMEPSIHCVQLLRR